LNPCGGTLSSAAVVGAEKIATNTNDNKVL
jgi:hypothetical protein